MYFKLNILDNNLSPKQWSHQDTPVGIQCSYLKSVQTPQPTCVMALAAGWEPASARALFNWAGNGCFPNQSFEKSRNTYFVNRIYGFIPPRRRSQSKWTKFNSIRKAQLWSPFSKGNWGCWWNKLAPGNTGTFLSLKKYFALWDFKYSTQFRRCLFQELFVSSPVLWVPSFFFMLHVFCWPSILFWNCPLPH